MQQGIPAWCMLLPQQQGIDWPGVRNWLWKGLVTEVHSGQRGPFRQDSGLDQAGKQWQRLLNGCEFQRK